MSEPRATYPFLIKICRRKSQEIGQEQLQQLLSHVLLCCGISAHPAFPNPCYQVGCFPSSRCPDTSLPCRVLHPYEQGHRAVLMGLCSPLVKPCRKEDYKWGSDGKKSWSWTQHTAGDAQRDWEEAPVQLSWNPATSTNTNHGFWG